MTKLPTPLDRIPQAVAVVPDGIHGRTATPVPERRGMPVYVCVISAVLVVLALSGFLIRPTYLRLTRPASSSP